MPIVLWMVTLVVAFHVPAGVAAESTTVSLFYYVAAVSCITCLWGAVSAARRGATCIWSGLLCLLLLGLVWYGFRFQGTAEIGERDRLAGFAITDTGRWSKIPMPEISLQSIWSGKSGKVLLGLGDAKRECAVGGRTYWRGYCLKPTVRGYAPLFILDDAIGEMDKAGYYPLGSAGVSYFHLAKLPHRFYASSPFLPSPGPEAIRKPETLKITITRGKLIVFKGEMKRGENIEFEGHRLRFENGAPWIRLEINRYWIYLLLIPALALIGAGVAILLKKQHKE
ncbi:MAG: hypothetical protein WA003_17590 [Desulfuromonadaceae bacterium]